MSVIFLSGTGILGQEIMLSYSPSLKNNSKFIQTFVTSDFEVQLTVISAIFIFHKLLYNIIINEKCDESHSVVHMVLIQLLVGFQM